MPDKKRKKHKSTPSQVPKEEEDKESQEAQAAKFQRELCWCIEQLEVGLSKQNATARQVEEALRVLKLLNNPKTPFVKKRQVMRTTFGDYRSKMAKEEKQVQAVMKKKLQLTQVSQPVMEKSKFLKKSKIAPGLNDQKSASNLKMVAVTHESATNYVFVPSDNSFKFNFGGQLDKAEENVSTVMSCGNNASNKLICIKEGEECDSQDGVTCHGIKQIKDKSNNDDKISSEVEELVRKASKVNITQEGNFNTKWDSDYKTDTKCDSDKTDTKCDSDKTDKKYDSDKTTDDCSVKLNENFVLTKLDLPVKTPEELEREAQTAQFNRELCWCLEQLEVGLSKQNATAGQAREATRVLKLLKNPKTPFVKKRQVMRTTFGDYRSKMVKEEKQAKTAMRKKLKLTQISHHRMKKSTFYRRSFLGKGNLFSGVLQDQTDKFKLSTEGNSTVTTPKQPTTNFVFIPSDNSFKFHFNADGATKNDLVSDCGSNMMYS